MRTYKECEEYLLNIPKFKKKTLLSDTKRMYELLGSPAKNADKIHVAGTNGKGSTCYFISEILKAHDIKTGLFTSPHLVSMRERFIFDNRTITEDEFIEIFEEVYDKCSLFEDEDRIKMHPSFFEYLFLMFMLWMERVNAKAVVLETGLGGTLDATNIFDDEKVSVICSVGMDHTEQLGNTLAKIASQKAGIIKKNVPLVLWENKKEANDVIIKRAEECDSKVYLLKESDITLTEAKENHIDFSLNISYDDIAFVQNLSIRVNSKALYQRINASMAICASKIYLNDKFDEEKAKSAFDNAFFKGRFEEIYPGFVTDGAHNENAVLTLLETLKSFKEQRVLIFGACEDKDYKTMVSLIQKAKVFDEIVFTRVNTPRSASPLKLKDACETKENVYVTDSFKEAVKKAGEFGKKVYIAGSLYLVGEAIDYFKTKSIETEVVGNDRF